MTQHAAHPCRTFEGTFDFSEVEHRICSTGYARRRKELRVHPPRPLLRAPCICGKTSLLAGLSCLSLTSSRPGTIYYQLVSRETISRLGTTHGLGYRKLPSSIRTARAHLPHGSANPLSAEQEATVTWHARDNQLSLAQE